MPPCPCQLSRTFTTVDLLGLGPPRQATTAIAQELVTKSPTSLLPPRQAVLSTIFTALPPAADPSPSSSTPSSVSHLSPSLSHRSRRPRAVPAFSTSSPSLASANLMEKEHSGRGAQARACG
ncbi:hypothetical protein E2562_015602 [Oryza meyeriana var. granulata]|uniref:Uncharacterized protein n=1 Tax=Oryza meyeriana var. granulata TaxID=110450 RepID=A0A6G1EKS2_9ORYZ|nr:hypothetical protein E2562_015602 [Oryza meyeriana var. granulata]